MVQDRHDGGNGDGFPVFNMEGPAPNIARAQEYETFFGGPFEIWTADDTALDEKVCRVVRRYELMQLCGLGRDSVFHLLQVPVETLLQRMRYVPGAHGLAALFASVRHAKMQRDMAQSIGAMGAALPCGHEEEGLFGNGEDYDAVNVTAAAAPLSHAYIGDVNPLTTIALPSDEDWRGSVRKRSQRRLHPADHGNRKRHRKEEPPRVTILPRMGARRVQGGNRDYLPF